MNIKKTSFGHIIWILPEEQENLTVNEEIEKLRKVGTVAIMVSGNENVSEILCKLIKRNISN
jgi:heptaprenylglyceryl phosphate synthase